MNSYPAELLVQLAPVMFVAGLENIKPSIPATPAVDEKSSSTNAAAPTPKRANSTDAFALLASRLREALGAQRKPAIWVPEQLRKSKSFQVVFVDKTVQFPPRKTPDPTSSQIPHSPLSPLHPSSPLHPDGIMAPIWIRKHNTLVPSVFVLFLRLFESSSPASGPRSPLEPDAPSILKEREDGEKEDRRHDAELALEIAERKKLTNERGMKLTVVLLASRRMLDDPSLDGRLTFIRRTSGLDSRAALFVLSPVSPAELADFVKSLQQALFDPAIEYYTAHSKRVRRKRNRHTQTVAAQYVHGLARPLPLRPEGWTVRYEYKMACFAEFRGEEEVALKHYQDAYSTLLDMFGSPTVLVPRTKRWAEAKVLADSINIKICKLFLYNAEHSLALSQFNTHVKRFSDLSRAWGIGDETYEYWSWIARQYRVIAELLEQGTHHGLAIPSHMPATSTGAVTSASQPQHELEALSALGVNPSTALMHPGFYYYFAAECTERRRARFLTMLEEESSSQGASQPPGFANEKKVDHLASILELYTKAYELFKKYNSTTPSQNQLQGRFTLWLAHRIALTYYETGKYEMTVRFFERISRTYSREKWGSLLAPLLRTWYRCAQQLGDVEMSIRLLMEMIARGQSLEAGGESDEESVEEDLHAILKSTVPSSDEPLVVNLTEVEPLLDSSVIFWEPAVKLGEQVAFQICLHVPTNVHISGLPVNKLRLLSSDGKASITVQQTSPDAEAESTQSQSTEEANLINRINVGRLTLPQSGDTEVKSDLRLQSGGTMVLLGTISSEVPQEVKFTNAEIHIKEGNWNIEVPFVLGHRRHTVITSPKWWTTDDGEYKFVPIRRANPSSLTIKQRPHDVNVVLSHYPPAYLDEQYPISIEVTNNDDSELGFSLDALLQPGEDDSVNQIMIGDEQSSGLIKGISFGTLHPGTTACKTLHLLSSGKAGERMMDVSVQSRTTIKSESGSTSDPGASRVEAGEVLQSLVIPTVEPFHVSHETIYGRCRSPGRGPADLSTFDPEYWDDSDGGRATVTTLFEFTDCVGASNVIIENVRLEAEESQHTRMIHCSLECESFPIEFFPGDQFAIVCELSLAPPDDFFEDPEAVLYQAGKYCLDWTRTTETGSPGSLSSTQISLPPLKPSSDGLVAFLHAPPLVHLHEPFTLELTIRNRHPTRSACPIVSLDLEPSESFIAAGIRNGRLPTIIPGAEEKVAWNMIPLDCGPAVPLPKIRVIDGRRASEGEGASTDRNDRNNGGARQPQPQPQPEGAGAGLRGGADEIRVIDVRWDRKRSDGSYVFPMDAAAESPGGGAPAEGSGAAALDLNNISGKRFTLIVSPA